jgi:hypothetical protein
MPRKSPHALRAEPPRSPTRQFGNLRITVCPGPPLCAGFHSQIYVDGTEIVAATDPMLRGLDPDALLRPGGPLYPADYERHAGIAYLPDSCGIPECHGMTIRIRLTRDAVIWSGLCYQDFDGKLVEQVRFDLGDYLRALAEAREDAAGSPPRGAWGV